MIGCDMAIAALLILAVTVGGLVGWWPRGVLSPEPEGLNDQPKGEWDD